MIRPLVGSDGKGVPYFRHRNVEAEIEAVLEWPMFRAFELALNGRLQPQTLVYLMRNFRPNRPNPQYDRLVLAFFSRLQRSGERLVGGLSQVERERVDELVKDKAIELHATDKLDIFEMSFKTGAERLYLTAIAKVRLRSRTERSCEDLVESGSALTGEEAADLLGRRGNGAMPLAEAKAMLADVMEHLTDRERLAVHYVHELGLTEAEAAGQLGCTDRNVRYLISSARRKALGQGKGARGTARVSSVKQ